MKDMDMKVVRFDKCKKHFFSFNFFNFYVRISKLNATP